MPEKQLSLNGVEILIRPEDKYVNATLLCQAGGRLFNDWSRLKRTKLYIEHLSSTLGTSVSDLISYQKGSIHIRSTWVHPMIATNIAQWISSEFAVKVSIWIEEWREIQNNNQLYIEALSNLNPDCSDQKEKDIRDQLLLELGGETEVKTKHGFIDLLTSTQLIEVKYGPNWKHGLGQLCVYGEFYPGHRLRLHLFDIEPDSDIKKICSKFNILVTYH